MDEQLKDRVRQALLAACRNDPKATVELEDVAPDKVAGTVLSATFEPLSPSERQERIWEELDQLLTPAERTRIVFIVADTPEEYEAIREANRATG